MPVHTYHCEECDHEFDAHQAFSDNSLSTCPNCGKETLYKIYKPALVVFKGKGFYVTDSKSSKATLTSGTNHKGGSNGDGASESKESGTKEKSKTETKTTENKKTEKSKE
jgi:putative FmdB family regulatory protein